VLCTHHSIESFRDASRFRCLSRSNQLKLDLGSDTHSGHTHTRAHAKLNWHHLPVPEPLQTFWQGITITELLRLAGVTVSETTLPSLKTPSTVVLSGAASLKSTSQEQGHAPARHTGDTWRRKLRQRKLATKLTARGGQPKPATRSFLVKTKYLPR
jgi:hypothetical protein